MKVLIVDDDIVDRKLIRRTLATGTSAFHEIVEANSVTEGLAATARDHFDVILLDYRMPEMDGIELLIELRAKPDLGDTAIVMVSASDDQALALECIEAGAQDFLTKNEITSSKLNKAILHAHKRFELEQRMHESYLAVKRMAERDSLTGLSNRFHFEEILKVMLANNKRLDNSVALLALDLDEFKNINDTLGHDMGDRVLIEAVQRVGSCLRENEGFARLGGDEFAVIIGGINDVAGVSAIANRILAQFSAPFVVDEHSVQCGVSIGVALSPADATSPSELMKCADIAMYRSKQGGKNRICFYEAYYETEFRRRASIQNEIASTFERSAFYLVYQPILDASSGEIDCVEALIRWPDTEPRYTPAEFIPIAEESRLIDSLGRWIIDTAVAQLAQWQAELAPSLCMSINISPVQLEDAAFLPDLVATLERHGVAAPGIVLEITETALFRDSEKISEALSGLSKHGFRIALDDFGMGFSSISHLIDHPISIVKLDRTMQLNGDQSSKRHRILEGLVLMLQKLGLETVAEGIETQRQRDVCASLNVDKLQGYFFARPMPAHEIGALLSGEAGAR